MFGDMCGTVLVMNVKGWNEFLLRNAFFTQCGHCKKMAPDWEKLAKEWDGHAVGLVAEVDCTTEGKPLCDANGVKGFPSLKYGDPAGLDDYQGSRAYDDLAKFAKENLKPVCSVANIDLCDDEKKKQIETYQKLSVDELNAAIKAEEEKLTKAEDDFKEAVAKLQAEYQKLSEEKDATVASVKSSGLGVMKSVLAAMSKEDKKDEL
jgi:thiol-disulfide isomerase/thioredoxin